MAGIGICFKFAAKESNMLLRKLTLGMMMILSPFFAAKAQLKINYELSFKEPQAHYAEVQMELSGLSKEFVDVKMPAWAPGSYLIREFAKNVEGFQANASGKALKAEKINKNTWRVYTAGAKDLKVNYSVYAFEISVRTSFVDDSHAFISPTGIFMYPDGSLASSSTVKVVPFQTWSKVSTGLEPVAGKKFTYTASDYDVLFDSPIEIGNQDIFEFTAAGVKHEVAMYGGGNYDAEKLKADMAKIVEQGTAIYGENPNKHYTFIVHNFQRGGGGLEHLNSTVLGASRDAYATEAGYKGFLNLVAHEYYHLWNVKRLRPVALGPFDYENENYTTNLWISEGFTAYYENKLMLRSGLWTNQEFVSTLADAITAVVNTPGAKIQSASEASFDSWIKFYRPNENSANTTVSYYSKGELIGLLMDIEIAQATKGAKSLDDVMKAMYEKVKAEGKGYTDAEFKAMAEKISGISLTDFYNKYIYGTAPIEYQKYLGYAGINVKDENAGKQIPYLGVSNRIIEGRNFISSVSRNSAAWTDGLNVNDEVISIDGVPAERNINQMIVQNKKVGDIIQVKVLRDGLEKDFSIKLKASPNVKLSAELNPKATAAQKAVWKRWTGV